MTTLEAIELPGLVWSDEFDWSGVYCEAADGINGNLVAREVAITDGRPVTLRGDAETGWLQRSDLLALQALSAMPHATYTLNYNGAGYTVRWRHEDAPVIQATPIVGRENAAAGDYYHQVTLKLITV